MQACYWPWEQNWAYSVTMRDNTYTQHSGMSRINSTLQMFRWYLEWPFSMCMLYWNALILTMNLQAFIGQPINCNNRNLCVKHVDHLHRKIWLQLNLDSPVKVQPNVHVWIKICAEKPCTDLPTSKSRNNRLLHVHRDYTFLQIKPPPLNFCICKSIPHHNHRTRDQSPNSKHHYKRTPEKNHVTRSQSHSWRPEESVSKFMLIFS